MAVVYWDYMRKRFTAPRMSWAWILKVIAWLVIIILPFFLAYWSHSFWKRTETLREQPKVSFTHELLFIVEGPSTLLYYSTIPAVQALLDESKTRVPEMKVVKVDENVDTIVDSFNLTLRMPLEDDESVTRAHLVAFFKYELEERVEMVMNSPVFVSEESGTAGSEVHLFGSMLLRQLDALSVLDERTIYQNSIIDSTTLKTISDITMPTLMSKAFARNESAYFEPAYKFWTSGAGPDFTMNLHMRVPETEVTYQPEAWEELKFAWIQYLAIAFIIYFFVNLTMRFVYSNQLVATRVLNPGVPMLKQHQF